MSEICIEYLAAENNMFESLIEEPQVSQQLLNKLTTEFINRHDVRRDCLSAELGSDLTCLSEQLRLYGQALEQLSPHTLALKAFHHQLFRLLDFLARFTNHTHAPYQPQPILTAFCRGCSEVVQHRNIRQLHRELIDGRPMSVDQTERESIVEGLGERDEVTNEEWLVRRMGNLQQNISERQVNLIRCIDDFQTMRNDMMLGLRKREFDRDFDSFDMKAYALQLTTHFMSSLARVQQKIDSLKRSIHAVEDQAVQTISLDVSLPAKTEPKLVPNRSEADFRRLTDQKIRLQENCRRYQLELRESQLKLEALQSSNKNLREQANFQRLRRQAKEKAVRNAEREEKLKQEERAKRQSFEILMAADHQLADQFEMRLLENYAVSGSRRISEEDIVPIIKATFKRTLQGFVNNRLSLNLNLNHRSHQSPINPTLTRESGSIDRRRNSRKKTIKIHMDNETIKEVSRFGHAYKQVHHDFGISPQINYKIMSKTPMLASAELRTSISTSNYKKAVMLTESSIKRRRHNYSNLHSLISEMKQNQRQNSSDHLKKTIKTPKYDKNLQTEHLPFPAKTAPKKRKGKLNRKNSTAIDDKVAHQDRLKMMEEKGLQLQGVRLVINSSAVKQFLFVSELEEQPTQHMAAFRRDQQPLSIQSLSGQLPQKKEKVILNLQEINYLTNFYSLLAKIHMVDAQVYNKIKGWIMSKGGDRVQKGRQSMVLKQIVSEIVFKHRQCKPSISLCPHLIAFIRELENTLRGVSLN